jgi:hypothetical protein
MLFIGFLGFNRDRSLAHFGYKLAMGPDQLILIPEIFLLQAFFTKPLILNRVSRSGRNPFSAIFTSN